MCIVMNSDTFCCSEIMWYVERVFTIKAGGGGKVKCIRS